MGHSRGARGGVADGREGLQTDPTHTPQLSADPTSPKTHPMENPARFSPLQQPGWSGGGVDARTHARTHADRGWLNADPYLDRWHLFNGL
jgi:hypothetical protein